MFLKLNGPFLLVHQNLLARIAIHIRLIAPQVLLIFVIRNFIDFALIRSCHLFFINKQILFLLLLDFYLLSQKLSDLRIFNQFLQLFYRDILIIIILLSVVVGLVCFNSFLLRQIFVLLLLILFNRILLQGKILVITFFTVFTINFVGKLFFLTH